MPEDDAAGFAIFRELALWTTVNCQPFEPSFIAQVLTLSRVSNLFSILALYFASLAHNEIYTFFFGIGSTLNWIFNILLRVVIRDRHLVSPHCIDPYGIGSFNSPSQQTQNAAFMVTTVATYCVMYGARINLFRAFFLIGFFSFNVAGDRYLNGHSVSQISTGALVGIGFALVWQAFIRRFVIPRMPRILGLWFFRYFEYTDTLCVGE